MIVVECGLRTTGNNMQYFISRITLLFTLSLFAFSISLSGSDLPQSSEDNTEAVPSKDHYFSQDCSEFDSVKSYTSKIERTIQLGHSYKINLCYDSIYTFRVSLEEGQHYNVAAEGFNAEISEILRCIVFTPDNSYVVFEGGVLGGFRALGSGHYKLIVTTIGVDEHDHQSHGSFRIWEL